MNCNDTVPSISVIVPIYNASKWLDRCICSILAQTFTDFELILVDDGSTDDSGNICDKFAETDPRIRVIHKQNGGVSSARNTGIDTARGNYVTFCDADDTVDAHWLETFMLNIGDADVCVQNIRTISNDGTIAYLCVNNSIGNKLRDFLIVIKDVLGYQFCKMYKKELLTLNHIRFNTEVHIQEDNIFMLDICKYISSWRCVSEAHYNYYLPTPNKFYKPNTISHNYLIIKKLLEILEEQTIPDSLKDKKLHLKSEIISKIVEHDSNISDYVNLYSLLLKHQGWTNSYKEVIIDNIIRNCANKTTGRLYQSLLRKINKILTTSLN